MSHFSPHLIQLLQLGFGFDEREEHAKLQAAELLEQATEHIIVVQEVFSTLAATGFERLL